MFDIKEELKKLPSKPGVYLHKNYKDEVIYVGKAKVLKNRVRSYFVGIDKHDDKTKELVNNIVSFEYIVTETEVEALVLECNLIKKYSPKYNIMFKDGRGYPFIKIVTKEMYPRVIVTREYKQDGNKYFGPYVNMMAVNEVMELFEKIAPYRKCYKLFPRDLCKDRPCLNYQIKKCPAPCNKHITTPEYQKNINKIIDFLNGNVKETLDELNKNLLDASENLEFEKAIEYRDRIIGINKLMEKQKMENSSGEDLDIIGLARNDVAVLIQVFNVRKGKMLGRDQSVITENINDSRINIITEFIKQYYKDTSFIPSEILVEQPVIDETIEDMLKMYKGSKVLIKVPSKGTKKKFLDMAQENANLSLNQFGENLLKEQKRTIGALEEIRDALGIDKIFNRIESYDISNTQGYESVGSMVVFYGGKPKRDDYRKFKIKTVVGADDYKSMYEVISRRLNRYINEKEEVESKKKFSSLPDAFFIDGGKGQVTMAKKVLKELGITGIYVVGLVKDDNHQTRGMIFEDREILLKKTSEGFKLITRIQDEVHRFALEYHKKLRQKGIHSILDNIEGVGPSRRNALLKEFKGLDEIKNATIDELMKVSNINKNIAENIKSFFEK
ncbi:MAG: excinuclease ABC subunit UvrC [Lachnospirales bacterium]